MTSSQKSLFEALAREHVPALDLFLRSGLRDNAEVDDVVQETLITAWRRLDDFDPSRPFGPWLRGIARRIVSSRSKDRARRSEFALDSSALDALEERVSRLEMLRTERSAGWTEALARCVEQLPERMGLAIRLRYEEGADSEAIAHRLGIGAANARKILQRSRESLATCLDAQVKAAGESL